MGSEPGLILTDLVTMKIKLETHLQQGMCEIIKRNSFGPGQHPNINLYQQVFWQWIVS